MPDIGNLSGLKGRIIQLGFKKASPEGLTPEEEKELANLKAQLAQQGGG